MAPSSSRPLRSSRLKVQSYNDNSASEGEVPEESDSEQTAFSRPPISPHLRPNRARPSYREQTTDESFDSLFDEATSDNHGYGHPHEPEIVVPVEASTSLMYRISHTSSSVASGTTSSRKRKSRISRSTRHSKKGQRELGRPLSKRGKIGTNQPIFVGPGVIPPWQTLPYHVLFEIFCYASYPFIDERTGLRHSSVQWLVNVALLCRAFHEPALAALYYSPPLVPANKCHGLLNLLFQPQDSTSTNYANKIKELHVDAEALLLYKNGPALGYFDLSRLIERTPQVKKIRLYHREDFFVGIPPEQLPLSKWHYPKELFTSITERGLVLRSWDWNSRFLETDRLILCALAQHEMPSFHNLREVRLLHIASVFEDYGRLTENDVANGREMLLASALKELPALQRIEFIECPVVNDHLFKHLPSNLTSIVINNCDEVTSSNLAPFLTTHGHHLRELILLHNRHLNMSFIVGLAKSCKSLVRFKMDLSIHDHSSYHDVEPHFAELFYSSQVPTWPTTLQDIELIQLRNWDDEAAEVFFKSLIDSAHKLKNLRRLVISAILKIGWRDRASFREKWIGNLEHVFLRQSPPPDSSLRSVRPSAYPLVPNIGTRQAEAYREYSECPPGSGLNGVALPPSKRKSARLAGRKKFSEGEECTGSNSSQVPDSGRSHSENNYDATSLPVQGMCDVVMIRIDNQRPSDLQFNEDDFLDDEESGDEEWNGKDIDLPANVHAW